MSKAKVLEKGKRITSFDNFSGLLNASVVWHIAAFLASLVFTSVVFAKMVPVAGAADASGYMNYAKLLDQGRWFEELRLPEGNFEGVSKSLFQPLGMTYVEEKGALAPTYPLGFPAMLAVGGLHASQMAIRGVFAGIGLFSCWGMWLLARELDLGPAWRFYGVAALVCSPLYLWSSLILMSDFLATGQAIWVMLSAMRAGRMKFAALACGLLIGWAVLNRPSSALLFLPVVALFFTRRVSWNRWIWFGLGGLPAFGIFLWSNQHLHGGYLSSGYSDLWSLFRFEYGPKTILHYAWTLPYALGWIVSLTGFLALLRLRDCRVQTLLWWVIPIFAFYGFYFFTAETWWFMRFVLPAFPGLILLSAIWIQSIVGLGGRLVRYESLGIATIALGFALGLFYWEKKLNILGEQDFESRYLAESVWAKENLPEGTLVVCMQASGAIYYYTQFPIFRWDLASESDWAKFEDSLRGSERPVVALLHEFEEDRPDSILRSHPKSWEPFAEVTNRIRVYTYRPESRL